MSGTAKPNQFTLRNTGVDKNYVPTWGEWEALREFLQNQMDGCIIACGSRENLAIDTEYRDHYLFYKPATGEEVGYITYDPATLTLRVSNVGTFYTKGLLLGGTSKREGNPELLGVHGEGMKLAALVCVRLGMSVACRSAKSQWLFKLQSDPYFFGPDESACQCLFVDRSECNTEDNVEVIITGLSRESWENAKRNVLWLTPNADIGRISTPHGELLLGDYYRKKVFVKELFICDYPDSNNATGLSFGYNFWDMPLNRDRKGIEDLMERHKRTSSTLCWLLNHYHNRQADLVANLTANHCDYFRDNFLRLCYQAMKHTYHEFYFVNHAHLKDGEVIKPGVGYGVDANGGDRIWDQWVLDVGRNMQPIYHLEHGSVPAFLKDHGLPQDFYPTRDVGNWVLNGPLKKSRNYKSVQMMFTELQLSPIEEDCPMKSVERVVEILVPFVPNMKLDRFVFQRGLPLNTCYIHNGRVFFPREVLDSTDAFHKLLSHSLKLFGVDMYDFVRRFVQ